LPLILIAIIVNGNLMCDGVIRNVRKCGVSKYYKQVTLLRQHIC